MRIGRITIIGAMVTLVSCGSLQNLSHADKQEIADRAVLRMGLDVKVEMIELNPNRYQEIPTRTLKGAVAPHCTEECRYRMKIHPKMATWETYEVIAHEAIHIRQYHNGDFKQVGPWDAEWKGRLIKNWQKIPYDERPWEREAFIDGKRLAKELRKN